MNQPLLSRRPDIGAKINVSFEFFPPKTDAGFQQLFQTIEELRPINPSYVSVT